MVKLNKENLLNNINNSDDLYQLKKVLDKAFVVLKSYIDNSSDFLNPHELSLAKSILNSLDIGYSFDGGYDDYEYGVVNMYPSFLHGPKSESICAMKFPTIFGIKHKDVLGSLIGLGIDRRKIGDILIGKEFTYFFVKIEIKDFILYNLEKISNYNVKVSLKESTDVLPIKEYFYKDIVTSSLRLDTFLSQALNLSRSKIYDIISKDLVKVNFTPENKVSYKLKESDVISVKKYGRIIFHKILKTTKKDKYLCQIKIPK